MWRPHQGNELYLGKAYKLITFPVRKHEASSLARVNLTIAPSKSVNSHRFTPVKTLVHGLWELGFCFFPTQSLLLAATKPCQRDSVNNFPRKAELELVGVWRRDLLENFDDAKVI